MILIINKRRLNLERKSIFAKKQQEVFFIFSQLIELAILNSMKFIYLLRGMK